MHQVFTLSFREKHDLRTVEGGVSVALAEGLLREGR